MYNDEFDEQCGGSNECDARNDEQGVVGAESGNDACEVCEEGCEPGDESAQEESVEGGERPKRAEIVEQNDRGELTDEVKALLAAAEQRGYLRGRNERIEELMSEPAMWQRDATDSGVADESEVLFLNNRRRSIWDVK